MCSACQTVGGASGWPSQPQTTGRYGGMVQQQKMSFADRTLRAARAWVVVGIVALAVGPTARSASAALPSWTVFPRPTWTQALERLSSWEALRSLIWR